MISSKDPMNAIRIDTPKKKGKQVWNINLRRISI